MKTESLVWFTRNEIIFAAGVDPEDETDEVLGPVEPPFPSMTFKQNFTAYTQRDVFNKPGDPFHLFPFTPFEKILPSDAKFKG